MVVNNRLTRLGPTSCTHFLARDALPVVLIVRMPVGQSAIERLATESKLGWPSYFRIFGKNGFCLKFLLDDRPPDPV